MSRRFNRKRRRVFFVLLIFFLIILGIIGANVWRGLNAGTHVVTNKKVQVNQVEQKRINVLILGVGGGSHEGPNLTDTIIFASIDPKIKRVTLISIPRDLWIPEINAKINSAYIYGEEKQKEGGLLLAKSIVGKVVGQDIDYAIKIDFSGFVKAVDMVGGLDINVANTFDDYAYPITGLEDDTCGLGDTEVASASAQIASGSASETDLFTCRYEHLHFDRGETHMDGTTALKYVRSRHALGEEGSDFSRSKRQQKVIQAFKDKIFSMQVLLNPAKAISLINVVKDSIVTDIKENEYGDFIKLARQLKVASIASGSVDSGDSQSGREGLLMNPQDQTGDYGGAWVLVPAAGNGDYSQIKKYVDCEIAGRACNVTPTLAPSKIP
jgi:LCP family protein required for cell wall assembly